MVAQKPLYDSLLKRLAQHLRQRDGSVSLVDVGANIGDTLLACNLEPGDTALCIEPNAEYWPYLQRNLQLSRGHCLSVQSLVGRTDGALPLTALTSQGTARYITGATGESVQIRTIPTLMTSASMDSCNLLKIDTDGHDFECLRGAETLLKRSYPVVLFEADVFGNAEYGRDLIRIVSMLIELRYKLFILYTNSGHLFSFYTSETLQEIYKAAFYQSVSSNIYFDLLALPDNTFLRNELDFFARITDEPTHREAAHNIASAIFNASAA